MRYWGPNISSDGLQLRTSLDNQPLATAANTAANADAYEVRAQDVLRQISGNPQRGHEKYWDASHDYSSALQLSH
jgi:hypothetical protein